MNPIKVLAPIDLYQLSDQFAKIAGLLKVPDQLLQEVSDFMVAAAAEKVVEFINLPAQRKRTQEGRTQERMQQRWEELYNLIFSSPIRNLAPIINFFQKGPFIIKQVSYGTDPETKLKGRTIGEMFFNITHNPEDNTYDFDLTITREAFGKEPGQKIDELVRQVSQATILELLETNKEAIIEAGNQPNSHWNMEFEFNDETYLKFLTQLRAQAQQYQQQLHRFDTQPVEGGTYAHFKFSGQEFPYLNYDGELVLSAVYVDNEGQTQIIYSKEAWAGLWRQARHQEERMISLGRLYVYRDPSEVLSYPDLEEWLAHIRSTTRHELQHMIQTFLSMVLAEKVKNKARPLSPEIETYIGTLPPDIAQYAREFMAQHTSFKKLKAFIKHLKEEVTDFTDPSYATNPGIQRFVKQYVKIHLENNSAGLPPKAVRDPTRDPHGYLQAKPGTESPALAHPLRDIEFYTRLSDTIERFQHQQRNYPVALHPELAKFWVGEIPAPQWKARVFQYFKEHPLDYNQQLPSISQFDNFFSSLKANQPAKYQKAVKEFYKAIDL